MLQEMREIMNKGTLHSICISPEKGQLALLRKVIQWRCYDV